MQAPLRFRVGFGRGAKWWRECLLKRIICYRRMQMRQKAYQLSEGDLGKGLGRVNENFGTVTWLFSAYIIYRSRFPPI